MDENMDSLQVLKSEIQNCTKCDLYQSRKNSLFGEGNLNAGIMVIGEAPGREEDRTGRPFVGKSGQLLDKIFAACGFTREEHIFISNIVRCNPPGNRTPSLEEAKTCIPYLYRQIDLIQPKILILLGATSLKYIMGNNYKITRDHGKWLTYMDKLVMPVFHPAALLRNPDLKRPTWEDYKKIVWKYRELINPDHFSEHV